MEFVRWTWVSVRVSMDLGRRCQYNQRFVLLYTIITQYGFHTLRYTDTDTAAAYIRTLYLFLPLDRLQSTTVTSDHRIHQLFTHPPGHAPLHGIGYQRNNRPIPFW